ADCRRPGQAGGNHQEPAVPRLQNPARTHEPGGRRPMNPISCRQVTEQIELYVAGECAEPERSAIRRHLLQCPTCARIEGETRALLGLVELRLNESDQLGRLKALLRMEEKHKQPMNVLAFARRAAAVAALLLVAAGLSLWFRGQSPLDG